MKDKKDYLKYPTISKLSGKEKERLVKKAEMDLKNEKLEKLDFLFESGAVNQEDYERIKNGVLGIKKEETTIHTNPSNGNTDTAKKDSTKQKEQPSKTETKRKIVQNSLRKDLPEEKIINSGTEERIKKKSSKLPIYIGIIAVIIVGVLGYVFLNNNYTLTTNEDGNVLFGTYQGESIEWIVLDEKEDGTKLLLSKYLLDKKEYNEEFTDVTWETCTLRSYLNGDFYNEAFSTEEQSKIQTTKVVNNDNPEYNTEGGNDTEDKIFLLSIDEVNKYFSSDEEREATLLNGDSNWYWLRSPGDSASLAASVLDGGSVSEYGYGVHSEGGIRPAMWIQI